MMPRNYLLVLFVFLMGLGQSALAAPIVLQSLAVSQKGESTQVSLTLSAPGPVKIFALADPHRIVIDLPEVALKTDIKSSKTEGTAIAALRSGLFAPGTFRIVLDLKAPAALKNAKAGASDGPYKITFDLAPSDEPSYRASFKQYRFQSDGAAEIASPENAPPKVAALRPVPPPKPLSKAAASLPLVVIDPGHGGVDPGAISVKGKYEKDITLAFAKTLQQSLKETGRYRVSLTRDRDIFIPLRDRIAIARRAGADLFISLHADSHASADARGATVYTLSEQASDKEAEALAAKENRVDIIAGVDLASENSSVANILIDLAQRETLNHSVVFSAILIKEIGKSSALQNRPQRSAGFAVLKSPDIPSVLIEMGYLSNAKDESLLNSKQYRVKLAQAITRAVDGFFAKRTAATAGNEL